MMDLSGLGTQLNMGSSSGAKTSKTEFLEDKSQTIYFEVVDPRSVQLFRGWNWLEKGFYYFKKSSINCVPLLLSGIGILLGISEIPIVGQTCLILTSYIWFSGIMLGCQAIDRKQQFSFNYLFAGSLNNANRLIALSLLMQFLSIAFGVLMVLAIPEVTYFELLMVNLKEPSGMTIAALSITVLFYSVLAMMSVFAPTLIALNNVSCIRALKLSFMGCLKNGLPFFLFGLFSFLLFILSLIPLFLGLLVFVPIVFGAIYSAYKEIFIEQIISTPSTIDEKIKAITGVTY